MRNKIVNKLIEHAKTILEKEAITNEECLILLNCLSVLEAEERRKEAAESADRSKNMLLKMIETNFGGELNGL